MGEHDKRRRLNWRQACEKLRCGKSRFYRMVANGVIPAHRFRGSRRGIWVYEDDLAACVETFRAREEEK